MKTMRYTDSPGSGGRPNGLPPSVDYVYRGTGADIMPDAIMPLIDDDRQGPGRKMTRGARRCAKCGRDRRSKIHKTTCRSGG